MVGWQELVEGRCLAVNVRSLIFIFIGLVNIILSLNKPEAITKSMEEEVDVSPGCLMHLSQESRPARC